MRKRIVIVGSINLDLVVATHRIPLRGETVAGSSFRTFSGGKGANQAVAVARLGGAASLIGKVGQDAFGIQLRDSLSESGVDTDAIGIVPGSTGVALITTDATGDNSITIVAGANAQLAREDLDANLDLIRSAGILLAQLEVPLETVEYLISIAVREKIPIILDPAPARTLPSSMLKCVDWLTPNETETSTLLERPPQELSEQGLADVANTLLESGCKNVILKLGSRGCYLALADGTRRLLPAFSVRALDTTAAGDAFNGALAVALMAGKEPIGAASWASAVAAVSVTRHGAQPSMPTPAEVEAFLDENQSAVPESVESK
jgi:ribokinase